MRTDLNHNNIQINKGFQIFASLEIVDKFLYLSGRSVDVSGRPNMNHTFSKFWQTKQLTSGEMASKV